MSTPETIPDPDELRAEIRKRAEELRAKRRLLRLAEAARAARLREAARAAAMSLTSTEAIEQGDRDG
jgi:hypothetical protein